MKVFHDPFLELHRSPFGAVSCGSTVSLGAVCGEDECFLLTGRDGGETVRQPMRRREGLWRAELRVPDEPCLIWYRFECPGYTEREARQITVYRESSLPEWYAGGIVYQIFPDRFFRGSDWRERRSAGAEKKTHTPRIFHENWNDVPFYRKDADGRVTHWDFFGGTLLGIEEKLDYLKSLGVTAIYLNPIFSASSNHRYDTADYLHIDPALGDGESFASLASAAEKKGIRLILDGVFSHTGADSIYFDKFGIYGGGACSGEESKYYRWYDFRRFPGEYACWWGEEELPELNENEPGCREFLLGAVRKWLKAGASGWRLDVADELPDGFIEAVRRAAGETRGDALILGEVWEDASNKISYGERRRYLLGGALHAVMNYPFRSAALDFAVGKAGAGEFALKMMRLRQNYPPGAFYGALNVISTHDTERALTLLGGDVGKLKMLSFLQFTAAGVPCIYYGDEAGAEGGTDPENRAPFPWGRENGEITEHYRYLAGLREKYPQLRNGEFFAEADGEDIYRFRRGDLRFFADRKSGEFGLE
ncbi:MAG: glycoside hydrolase family 13 protein [Oscillospiraceae bacterium]|nr:glycoside hydrolase family 13 protein [Oscillospiraceae bacterium]